MPEKICGLWTFLWVSADSFLVLDMIYVTGIPPGDRGLQWAVENTGMPLWFRNNRLPALGASSEVFELRPVCQWERGIPCGHDFFFFKEEWKSWKRRATSFGLYQPITLRNVFESKTLNKSLKKKVAGEEGEVPYLVLDPEAAVMLWPESLTSSWAVGNYNEYSSPPASFCFCPAYNCHYPTFYCSHSSSAERLGDDIKVVEDVVCIKASPPFFSASPCPFSCIRSVPIGFCPPLQTSGPFTELINDCFNNITAPPFSCVDGPSGMLLVTKAGRDFYFHPFKGHQKYRE